MECIHDCLSLDPPELAGLQRLLKTLFDEAARRSHPHGFTGSMEDEESYIFALVGNSDLDYMAEYRTHTNSISAFSSTCKGVSFIRYQFYRHREDLGNFMN